MSDTTSAAADTLTLDLGGQRLLGWQRIRVTRGIERMPSDFDLEVTERSPDGGRVAVIPGTPCTVKIGGDVVLTGYVDRYTADIGVSQHQTSLSGRSRCEDIVDCAAVYPGAQISAGSVLQLAQDLCKPYSITASGEAGPSVPQFNLNLGETAWEIIDRVTRYGALLAYDAPDGNLVLSKLGTTVHASGFEQGVNVQSANVSYGMDQRYSEYVAAYMSVDKLSDLGTGGNLLGTVKDEGVKRFRRRVIVSEQTINGQPLALARATWERNRRYGRSQAVTVVCDTWRDSGGTLWQPNQLAPVHIPALKIVRQQWLISEVGYERDGRNGTTARVTLMPREAFEVEPVVLQPFGMDLQRAIDDANKGSGAPAVSQISKPGPGHA